MLGRVPGCGCELGVFAGSIPNSASSMSVDYLTGRKALASSGGCLSWPTSLPTVASPALCSQERPQHLQKDPWGPGVP